ncbi:4'-phosphopantetheinyl transferase family protein [Roseiconus lacunae]|uniref:4'-phosphopantetheinyl transferase family protein n=1 Tax=Roseiconus lacunae TaxID=2605694 RepID=UPI001E4D3A92|nr:4'-phosphopantetheinyl transferase superfamily protein [Roseiconus lacunae]MCD0463219.1 4'-phosphopantetheinyl transferase superfamily protein [Roseiconus lacunae]
MMPSNKMQSLRLDVWHAPADREQQGAFELDCERWLPVEERRGADRYRLIRSRNQHVIGRAMARRLLADGNGTAQMVSPQSIRFTSGQHGKPEVDYPDQVKRPFNIAHTDGLVLCAVADQQVAEMQVQEIGVDVESLDRRTTTEVADRYFSIPEIDFLRSQPRCDQKFYFLKIWTLKEAYIKAIGTGLHTPLADFAFTSIETEQPMIRFLNPTLDDGRNWHFVCHQPRPGFIATAAIATQTRTGEVLREGGDDRNRLTDELGVRVSWNAFEHFCR